MAVQFALESLSRLPWNHCPDCRGIRVQFAVEYAPEWPEYDINQLVQVAFRGKIVTSLDHPVIQSLLGRI